MPRNVQAPTGRSNHPNHQPTPDLPRSHRSPAFQTRFPLHHFLSSSVPSSFPRFPPPESRIPSPESRFPLLDLPQARRPHCPLLRHCPFSPTTRRCAHTSRTLAKIPAISPVPGVSPSAARQIACGRCSLKIEQNTPPALSTRAGLASPPPPRPRPKVHRAKRHPSFPVGAAPTSHQKFILTGHRGSPSAAAQPPSSHESR